MTTGPAPGATVCNLCFHGIGTPARELEPDEGLYWVAEEQFEELLDVVARHRDFRLTFDDGNASDARLALPALQRRGLEATFFMIAGRIDRPGSVSASDVRELARAGMAIGNHGQRHRAWRGLGDRELREELVGARAAIAELAGVPVDQASCPFGAYDRSVVRAVRSAGFERLFTVDGGPARADEWLQSRHTVVATDSPASIERLADSGDGGPAAAAGRAIRSAVKRWR